MRPTGPASTFRRISNQQKGKTPLTLRFCSLSSGSSGNCYLAGSDRTLVLVDAGISARQITERLKALGLKPEDLSGILITHEHSDHIKGIDTLSKKYHLPLYMNSATEEQLRILCKYHSEMDIRLFENSGTFRLGDLDVRAFPVSHDAADTVGFALQKDSAKICTATDTGCVTEEIMEELTEADLMILEANHDEEILKMGRYPWFLKQRILSDFGHLSNEAAGLALAETVEQDPRPRQVLLAHLSKENNFPEMAWQTVVNVLESRRIYLNDDLRIDLLKRDEMSGVYVL